MTTASTPMILRAALGTLLAGAAVVLVAAVAGGSGAVPGALLGAGLAVVVLGSGTLAVAAVASILPAASLLVALLTYTLQVVLLGLLFVALPVGAVDRHWLGVALVVATLTWSVAQIRLATTARIPVYDLPSPRCDQPLDAGAR